MVLRWVLYGVAALLLVHCAGLSWFGAQDLAFKLPIASAVLYGSVFCSVALIVCGVVRRFVLPVSIGLVLLAIVATLLAPVQAVNKVGADRDLLMMLLIVPALGASALMIWSLSIANAARRLA